MCTLGDRIHVEGLYGEISVLFLDWHINTAESLNLEEF